MFTLQKTIPHSELMQYNFLLAIALSKMKLKTETTEMGRQQDNLILSPLQIGVTVALLKHSGNIPKQNES